MPWYGHIIRCVIRFGCGPPSMGNGLDWLRSTVALFGLKKPDLTGLVNTKHSASGRAIIYSLHSHGYFYLESTYHLPHESTNTRTVQPFSSTKNFRASSMQPGHQVSLAALILHSQRHPPPTRESITPQPLNPPSIDNTSQIHDPQQLSLLQFNIQPTHSHPS